MQLLSLYTKPQFTSPSLTFGKKHISIPVWLIQFSNPNHVPKIPFASLQLQIQHLDLTNFNFYISEPPNSPDNLTIMSVTSRTVRVSWAISRQGCSSKTPRLLLVSCNQSCALKQSWSHGHLIFKAVTNNHQLHYYTFQYPLAISLQRDFLGCLFL